MKVVCDIETDGLEATVIHLVIAKDIETGKYYEFREGDAAAFKAFALGVDRWIGHNFIGFDSYHLNRLWGTDITVDSIMDTLVLSRLFNRAVERQGRVAQTRSKHSLESWGETLSYPKGDFNDWSQYSEEMRVYCKQDVDLNHEAYKVLMKEGKDFSKRSISLEQQTQAILCEQMREGFKLDVDKAKNLLAVCKTRATAIEDKIQKDFPALPKLRKTYEPRLNKDGVSHSLSSLGPLRDLYGFGYDGDPYSSVDWVDFNLSSPTQVIHRLKGHWKPVEFTPKGSPKVSEKNLATVRDTAPESVRNLALYRMLTSRSSMIEQWLEAASDVDGRVRGRIVHIGSWSGRMAHQSPNTANIPGIKFGDNGPVFGEAGGYGHECRSLWTVEEGNKLVGTDASGIQLRVLAHYINNEVYTKAVLEDIHSFNAEVLGCTRPQAKTFIYSWLLGAGVAKTAEILSCSIGEATNKRNRFVELTPGLSDFLEEVKTAAFHGHFVGLDGRIVYVPNEHLALTAYLQNGEGVIMRAAMVLWHQWAKQLGIKYKQCAMVHDEFQVEVEEGRAEELGRLQVRSFRIAGEALSLNCPMDGEYNVGNNWADTH